MCFTAAVDQPKPQEAHGCRSIHEQASCLLLLSHRGSKLTLAENAGKGFGGKTEERGRGGRRVARF